DYFFFQAEDGIRDRNVTGVQTCALPIYRLTCNSIEHGAMSAKVRLVMNTIGCTVVESGGSWLSSVNSANFNHPSLNASRCFRILYLCAASQTDAMNSSPFYLIISYGDIVQS